VISFEDGYWHDQLGKVSPRSGLPAARSAESLVKLYNHSDTSRPAASPVEGFAPTYIYSFLTAHR